MLSQGDPTEERGGGTFPAAGWTCSASRRWDGAGRGHTARRSPEIRAEQGDLLWVQTSSTASCLLGAEGAYCLFNAGNHWKNCRTAPGKDQPDRVECSEEILAPSASEIWASFVFKVILSLFVILCFYKACFGHVLFQKEGGVFYLKAWADKGFYNSILSSYDSVTDMALVLISVPCVPAVVPSSQYSSHEFFLVLSLTLFVY